MKKAIKILDYNFYNKSIEEFRAEFKKPKDIVENEINSELSTYLKKIGFNLSHYLQNPKQYKNYKINCSRKAASFYYIEYIADNHNYSYTNENSHFF